ncbi:hypothetical protein BDK51DRAFT_35072 [Blyttiomyces helicus]|uniref:Uncharacterized protein n=1 Tax=Blyttiomyces helicus TaxID=388810 RepID=A0A4P9WP14_9FUNG|nr:hypothetical protein BDK51DRAFT_35072 [Blyttiomyces helicus]|eukprot:RKO94754.1 hypothetical protein BDK51DRAFT_35072 [Blyttiomyces helicus]
MISNGPGVLVDTPPSDLVPATSRKELLSVKKPYTVTFDELLGFSALGLPAYEICAHMVQVAHEDLHNAGGQEADFTSASDLVRRLMIPYIEQHYPNRQFMLNSTVRKQPKGVYVTDTALMAKDDFFPDRNSLTMILISETSGKLLGQAFKSYILSELLICRESDLWVGELRDGRKSLKIKSVDDGFFVNGHTWRSLVVHTISRENNIIIEYLCGDNLPAFSTL